ncbi:flagellar biosynthetic protein FliO [Wenzhouxiangella limi]|uniref:Flagellar protein n=1 Tax=Wenzhouxiangella limi TaxID=2707351 RepID=A0A845V0K9_9GAMM|nr:flagellar biosynthetic protein FliO [Wenzhouxiangella limi]NDY97147.1 flagellar biosynthetic protein FliO [Wenzhouxiangella limi]
MKPRLRALHLAAAASLAALPAANALAQPGQADAAQSLTRVTVGMLAVVVLIFGLAWAVRRFSFLKGFQGDGNNPIRNLAQLSVGPKERVVLIEVEGKRLLIGVAPGRITRLDVPDGESAEAGKDFATHLQASREARKK